MVRVSRLRWNPSNISHILRHGVRTYEVEEVVAGDYFSERGYAGRYVPIGPTLAVRMLAVVVEPEGGGTFYPVTARPASRKERRRYDQLEGSTS